MRSEITLAQWRTNLAEHNRFYNFWSNVSQIKIAKTVPDKISRMIVEAMERVRG